MHKGFVNYKRKKRCAKWNRNGNVRAISSARPFIKKIDKYIHFSFIRELTKDLYCHTNVRPAVDPVVLFKMLWSYVNILDTKSQTFLCCTSS